MITGETKTDSGPLEKESNRVNLRVTVNCVRRGN